MAGPKRTFAAILSLALGTIPLSAAGGANAMVVEPTAPAHRFLDAKNICLQSLNILAMAADVASTRRALEVPGTREMNPLARSQADLITLKIAGIGAGLGIAYMMHRSGHYKLERAIPVIFGVPSMVAAAHNSTIHR